MDDNARPHRANIVDECLQSEDIIRMDWSAVTMTGPIYRDDILEHHVRLFRDTMGAEFLFMVDNARPHHANIVDEFLQSEDIIRMDWSDVTMTGTIYRDDILEHHVRLFRDTMGAEFLFVDDNARPHHAIIVDEFLQSEDIIRMDWSAVTMTGSIYRDDILEHHVRLFRDTMGAEFLFMDDNARPHHANIVDEFLQSEDIIRMDWSAVTMTGPIYRDDILEHHVRLFRDTMGAEFLFMDDNARPHHANIVDEFLQSEDIIRMDWSAVTMTGPIYRDDILEHHVRFLGTPWVLNFCLWMTTPVLTVQTLYIVDECLQSEDIIRMDWSAVTMAGPIYRDDILEHHVRLFRDTMVAEFLFMDDNARPHHANIVDEFLQSEDIIRMDWSAVTMTGPIYRDDILNTTYVCLGTPWVLNFFMDDNANPHRANIVDECLQSEDIIRTEWAAYSPGLKSNRACVGICLADESQPVNSPPTCLPELRKALLDEWCIIPQDQIDNLILSMPRRCKATSGLLGASRHENGNQNTAHRIGALLKRRQCIQFCHSTHQNCYCWDRRRTVQQRRLFPI
ncbi:transposable element Tcb1 transposase [Trichonephila clavipes]|nr:transposable element Tcb1 transposase [Trichonephila clavipes]